MPKR